jgi:hypothetical protein
VTTANAVPQLTADADLVVASADVPGGRDEGLGLIRTAVSWEGFCYLQLMVEMRLSLPPKLPVRAPMPASLEPIWLREDLPVRLLTTRNENFLVDSGVPR